MPMNIMPMNIMPTVEEPQQVAPPMPVPEQQRLQSPAPFNSPHLGHLLPVTNSPKRPLEDAESEQPRKIIRGESPLKGAAGRRLDAARRNNAVGGVEGSECAAVGSVETFCLFAPDEADLANLPAMSKSG